MTKYDSGYKATSIIPYQELLGNYDLVVELIQLFLIIPYQELLGNHPFVKNLFFGQKCRVPG